MPLGADVTFEERHQRCPLRGRGWVAALLVKRLRGGSA